MVSWGLEPEISCLKWKSLLIELDVLEREKGKEGKREGVDVWELKNGCGA